MTREELSYMLGCYEAAHQHFLVDAGVLEEAAEKWFCRAKRREQLLHRAQLLRLAAREQEQFIEHYRYELEAATFGRAQAELMRSTRLAVKKTADQLEQDVFGPCKGGEVVGLVQQVKPAEPTPVEEAFTPAQRAAIFGYYGGLSRTELRLRYAAAQQAMMDRGDLPPKKSSFLS